MTDDAAAANKRLVRRFYKEVLVDWHMALVDDLLSARFRSHDWPEGGPTGPPGFRQFYAAIRSALPDARYEIDDLVAEDDRVVVRWRLLGTHRGAFQNVEPTGRAIVLRGIAIYRIEDHKLAERWVVTDLHRLLEEIRGTG